MKTKISYKNYSTKLYRLVQNYSLQTETEPPNYQLQIVCIPHEKRVEPDKLCKLIHHQSGLNVPGQFNYSEAFEILETTRYWDWELGRDRIPRCVERLRSLLEEICNHSGLGGEANA